MLGRMGMERAAGDDAGLGRESGVRGRGRSRTDVDGGRRMANGPPPPASPSGLLQSPELSTRVRAEVELADEAVDLRAARERRSWPSSVRAWLCCSHDQVPESCGLVCGERCGWDEGGSGGGGTTRGGEGRTWVGEPARESTMSWPSSEMPSPRGGPSGMLVVVGVGVRRWTAAAA